MKKLIPLIFLSIIHFSQSFAQNWNWASAAGHTSHAEIQDIASYTGSDYFYVAGNYADSITLGRTTLISYPTTSWRAKNIFIAKYHVSGNLVWVKSMGSDDENEEILSIAVDSADNLFVNGTFNVTFSFGGHQFVGDSIPTNRMYPFLAKLSPNGNVLWNVGGTSTSSSVFVYFQEMKIDSYGDIYGIGLGGVGPGFPLIGEDIAAKINGQTGQPIWAKAFEAINVPNRSDRFKDLCFDQHNNLYLAGWATKWSGTLSQSPGFVYQGFDTIPDVSGQYAYSFLVKVNPDSGNAIWIKNITFNWGFIESISPAIGGAGVYADISYGGTLTFHPSGDTIHSHAREKAIVAIDTSGQIDWTKRIPYGRTLNGGLQWYPFYEMTTAGNHCFFAGETFGQLGWQLDSILLSPGEQSFIGAFDSTGKIAWATQVTSSIDMKSTGLLIKDDQAIIGGHYKYNSIQFGPFQFPFPIFSTSNACFLAAHGNPLYEPPTPLNKISGHVHYDLNTNCQKDTSEFPVINAIIESTPGPRYSSTDLWGNYTLYADTGNIQVKLLPLNLPFLQVNPICPPNSASYTLRFDSLNNDTTGIDFGSEYVGDTSCQSHLLYVNVIPGRGRVCSNGSTHFTYGNLGRVTASQVKVLVQYPPDIIPKSSNLSYTVTPAGLLEFNLGNVAPQQTGSFVIYDSVACNATIRTTSCITATISPPDPCPLLNPLWSGANLTISGTCLGNDHVLFTIYNRGAGNMTDSLKFRVLLNDTLQYSDKFKLNMGDSLAFQIASGGKTVRTEVDQEPHHPTNLWISRTVENCVHGGIPASLGFVMTAPQQYPQAASDMACIGLTGSYDPNDKQASPAGWGAQHQIFNKSRLTYRIRFQNTGNDTAFKVVLVDTLPRELDLTSLFIEGASHPFSWQLSGVGQPVLQFTFDPIALPDSNRDVVGSQGFVQFSINPVDTLIAGTRIENFADIYFDYNPPVRTPTVFHTIADSFPANLNQGLLSHCGDSIYVFAGQDTSFCSISALDTFHLQGNAHGPGLLSWKTLGGPATVLDPWEEQATISQLTPGVNYFEISSTLCSQIVKDTVVIMNHLAPAKPVLSMSGTHNICEPDSFPLLAPNGFTQYLWNTGDSLANVQVKKTGIYYVSVAGPNGCLSQHSDTASIHMFPQPEKATLTLMNDTTLCVGDSMMLAIQPYNSYTFLWNNQSTQSSLNIGSTGSFKGQYVNSFGCIGPPSDSIQIDFQQPTKPIIQPHAPVYCQGDTAILQVNPLINHQYLWSNGDSRNFIHVHQNGTFSVQISDSLGCRSDWADSFHVAFLIRPPRPSINPTGMFDLCEGDSISVTASGPHVNWLWNSGDSNPVTTLKNAGTYSVKGKGANGCFSKASDSVTIVTYPFPQKPQLLVTPSVINALNIPPGIILQWHDANGPISGANSPAIFPTTSNFYFLELIQPPAWCTTYSDTVNFWLTDIEKAVDNTWEIFPQPAVDYLWIRGPLRNEMNISISTIHGKRINSWEVENQVAEIRLNLEKLTSGIFILTIYKDNTSWMYKLIKQ